MPAANTAEVRHLNPLLSIWTKPRATMRHIVDTDPTKYLIVLLVVGAFFETLDRASARSFGDRWPIGGIFVLAVILAPLAVPLSILGAMMMRWAGAVLGGVATREQVRASIAWAGAPAIMFNVIAWPVQLALYRGDMFTTETPLMDDSNPFILLAVLGTSIIAAVWSFVVAVKVYAEVNRFSAWRGLGAGLMLGAIIFGPLLVIGVAIVLGTSRHL